METFVQSLPSSSGKEDLAAVALREERSQDVLGIVAWVPSDLLVDEALQAQNALFVLEELKDGRPRNERQAAAKHRVQDGHGGDKVWVSCLGFSIAHLSVDSAVNFADIASKTKDPVRVQALRDVDGPHPVECPLHTDDVVVEHVWKLRCVRT